MYCLYIIAAILLLLLIPKTRPHARYFVGYFAFGMVVMIGGIIYSVKFIIQGKPRYENSWYVCLILLLNICSTFTKVYRLARDCMGLKPILYGTETYDKDRQCIYVVNHQSFIDVLCKFFNKVFMYTANMSAYKFCV